MPDQSNNMISDRDKCRNLWGSMPALAVVLAACTPVEIPRLSVGKPAVISASPARSATFLADFEARAGMPLSRHLAEHAQRCLTSEFPDGTEFLAISGGNAQGQVAGFTVFADRNGNRAIDNSEVSYEAFGKFSATRVIYAEQGRRDEPGGPKAQRIIRMVASQTNTSSFIRPLDEC